MERWGGEGVGVEWRWEGGVTNRRQEMVQDTSCVSK